MIIKNIIRCYAESFSVYPHLASPMSYLMNVFFTKMNRSCMECENQNFHGNRKSSFMHIIYFTNGKDKSNKKFATAHTKKFLSLFYRKKRELKFSSSSIIFMWIIHTLFMMKFFTVFHFFALFAIEFAWSLKTILNFN